MESCHSIIIGFRIKVSIKKLLQALAGLWIIYIVFNNISFSDLSVTTINIVSTLFAVFGMSLVVAGAMANDSGRGGLFIIIFQFLTITYPLVYFIGLIGSISVLHMEIENKEEIARWLASMSLMELAFIVLWMGLGLFFENYSQKKRYKRHEKSRNNPKLPYLIHLPHCGVEIPDKYRGDYYLDDEDLNNNVYQYADLYTDELFSSLYEKFGGVKNEYSRLFFDPERFFDDAQEAMSKKGLGWFYEKAILEEKPLRDTQNKEAVAHYYYEHHMLLNARTEKKLKQYDQCTIIDCHSFSNERYWFHDKDIELPDICVGFEGSHEDTRLVDLVKIIFSDYHVVFNSPYSGSLVPTEYYQKDFRVKSVMIEINKKLYLEPNNIDKNSDFEKIQGLLEELMRQLIIEQNS